jgi:hypothetical protein
VWAASEILRFDQDDKWGKRMRRGERRIGQRMTGSLEG